MRARTIKVKNLLRKTKNYYRDSFVSVERGCQLSLLRLSYKSLEVR